MIQLSARGTVRARMLVPPQGFLEVHIAFSYRCWYLGMANHFDKEKKERKKCVGNTPSCDSLPSLTQPSLKAFAMPQLM